MDPGADEPSREELESRVAELEQTVSKMLPDRRGVLKGLGAAAIGGAAVGGATGGASGQSATGQVGTASEPVDVEGAQGNFNSVNTGELNRVKWVSQDAGYPDIAAEINGDTSPRRFVVAPTSRLQDLSTGFTLSAYQSLIIPWSVELRLVDNAGVDDLITVNGPDRCRVWGRFNLRRTAQSNDPTLLKLDSTSGIIAGGDYRIRAAGAGRVVHAIDGFEKTTIKLSCTDVGIGLDMEINNGSPGANDIDISGLGDQAVVARGTGTGPNGQDIHITWEGFQGTDPCVDIQTAARFALSGTIRQSNDVGLSVSASNGEIIWDGTIVGAGNHGIVATSGITIASGWVRNSAGDGVRTDGGDIYAGDQLVYSNDGDGYNAISGNIWTADNTRAFANGGVDNNGDVTGWGN